MPPGLRADAMRAANPAVIPRNHRVQQVINAAVERDDFSPFAELLRAITRPYEQVHGLEAFADAPQPAERVLETFCGT